MLKILIDINEKIMDNLTGKPARPFPRRPITANGGTKMILDRIENRSLYEAISPSIKKGLEYLATLSAEDFKEERIELDGKNLFVLHQLYETIDATTQKYENHARYIDIQYILEGTEIIRYADSAGLTVAAPYDETKDAGFFDLAPGTDCLMGPGDFALFFPRDAHAPKIAAGIPGPVKKAVVKVLIE